MAKWPMTPPTADVLARAIDWLRGMSQAAPDGKLAEQLVKLYYHGRPESGVVVVVPRRPSGRSRSANRVTDDNIQKWDLVLFGIGRALGRVIDDRRVSREHIIAFARFQLALIGISTEKEDYDGPVPEADDHSWRHNWVGTKGGEVTAIEIISQVLPTGEHRGASTILVVPTAITRGFVTEQQVADAVAERIRACADYSLAFAALRDIDLSMFIDDQGGVTPTGLKQVVPARRAEVFDIVGVLAGVVADDPTDRLVELSLDRQRSNVSHDGVVMTWALASEWLRQHGKFLGSVLMRERSDGFLAATLAASHTIALRALGGERSYACTRTLPMECGLRCVTPTVVVWTDRDDPTPRNSHTFVLCLARPCAVESDLQFALDVVERTAGFDATYIAVFEHAFRVAPPGFATDDADAFEAEFWEVLEAAGAHPLPNTELLPEINLSGPSGDGFGRFRLYAAAREASGSPVEPH